MVSNAKMMARKDLVEILRQLKRILWEWEYPTAFWQQLRQGLGIVPANRRPLPRCHPITQNLMNLFLHGGTLPLQRLQSILNEQIISTLITWNFLQVRENSREIASNVSCIPLSSRFLLLQPHPKRTTAQHPVYLGADSLMLSRFLLPRTRPRKVLDVGTGTGILLFSLPWQNEHGFYLGIDVNAQAIEIARLNAALNKAPWMKFQQLDLQDGLKASLNARFDLVIGNLPIIPTPSDPRCKWHGRLHADGGQDGQKYFRMVLREIPELLEPEGEAQLLACSLGSSMSPFLLEELRQWASDEQFMVTMVALKKIPVEIDAHFRAHGNMAQYKIWMNFFRQQRAEAWYRLIVRISNKRNGKAPSFRFLETLKTDFFEPIKNKTVDKRRVVLSFPHYLVEVGFANQHVKIEQLLKTSSRIVDFITRRWRQLQNLSIKEGAMLLKEHFPEAFPTDGAAMLAWGSCIEELDRKPPQLTRKLL